MRVYVCGWVGVYVITCVCVVACMFVCLCACVVCFVMREDVRYVIFFLNAFFCILYLYFLAYM